MGFGYQHPFLEGEVIYQTRERVFILGYPNTEKWYENTRRSRFFFNRLPGVWIPGDETLFQVFDLASQTIDNFWRN